MSLELKLLSSIDAVKANFVLTKYLPIPKNAVTLLSASGGTGKTRSSLIMADRYIQETGEKAALWLTEDYPGQVRAIFNDMIEHNLVSESSLNSMLLILNEPPQLAKRVQGVFKSNYEEINRISESLILNNVSFAVFDPLLAFYGGNENDNSEARVFIQAFAEWAKRASITTLIIHHANKDGASRGATAFHDGVRARYELVYPENDEGEINQELISKGFRIARLKKDNWGIKEHLWKLTDGEDEIMLKIAPPIKKHASVEVTTYSDKMEATVI